VATCDFGLQSHFKNIYKSSDNMTYWE